jgi:hypothetical protein
MDIQMAQVIETQKNLRIIMFVFFAILSALFALARYPDTGLDLIEIGVLGFHAASDILAVYSATRKMRR